MSVAFISPAPRSPLPLPRGERRTADVLVDVLVEAGVEVVFGIPGGAISPMFDALLDHPEVRVVTTRHETAAMFSAAAYARTTGKIGVAFVTSGPGVTNALTGLASAFCDGVPVLLLAGEVPRKAFGRGALQEGSSYHLDVVAMARHISKSAGQLHEPSAASSMLRRAIATALSGRQGPVTLTLPIDVASARIDSSETATGVSTSFQVHSWAIDRAARAMANGGCNAVFAGSGVRGGDGPRRLRELAEKLQLPVITTPKGKGVFPEDHPLSLGVFGLGGHPSTTEYLQEGLDNLLVIGTSLGDLSTNGWSPLLKPRAEMIHVDVDANQIGRSYSPTLGIISRADTFLSALADQVKQAPARTWLGLKYFSSSERTLNGAEGLIAPQRAIWEIQQRLPRDTIFTADAGEHFLFATHYLRIRHPDAFLVMTGLGSMGQSLSAAIGAQLAQPTRSVAAICGDGCFAMSCSELATAVAEKLPIVVFVFNDERLGMVELGHTALYGRTPNYPTAPMDVVGLARSFGARASRVEHAGDLLRMDPEIFRGHGPVVIDVRIDRSFKMPKNGRLEALGTAVTPSQTVSELK